jgi:hypothetical protein
LQKKYIYIYILFCKSEQTVCWIYAFGMIWVVSTMYKLYQCCLWNDTWMKGVELI